MSVRTKRPYRPNPQRSWTSIRDRINAVATKYDLHYVNKDMYNAYADQMSHNTFMKCVKIYTLKEAALNDKPNT